MRVLSGGRCRQGKLAAASPRARGVAPHESQIPSSSKCGDGCAMERAVLIVPRLRVAFGPPMEVLRTTLWTS